MTVLDALEQAIVASLPTLPLCPTHGVVPIMIIYLDGSVAHECEACVKWARDWRLLQRRKGHCR